MHVDDVTNALDPMPCPNEADMPEKVWAPIPVTCAGLSVLLRFLVGGTGCEASSMQSALLSHGESIWPATSSPSQTEVAVHVFEASMLQQGLPVQARLFHLLKAAKRDYIVVKEHFSPMLRMFLRGKVA